MSHRLVQCVAVNNGNWTFWVVLTYHILVQQIGKTTKDKEDDYLMWQQEGHDINKNTTPTAEGKIYCQQRPENTGH